MIQITMIQMTNDSDEEEKEEEENPPPPRRSNRERKPAKPKDPYYRTH